MESLIFGGKSKGFLMKLGPETPSIHMKRWWALEALKMRKNAKS